MSAIASEIPAICAEAVLQEMNVEDIPEDAVEVRGYDFNQFTGSGSDYDAILQSYLVTGFQATNMGLAINEINRMRNWRLSDEPVKEDEDEELRSEEARSKVKCKIFMGLTSNLISSGVRESIRFLMQHRMVDVVVCSAGGIEEDFIKCLAPTLMGDFALKGEALRKKGLNRIGNLLVPNSNYCKFEDWMTPILDQMLKEQKEDGVLWTPSKMIHRLGKEIDNEESVWYWCYKNNIPVFCPAITDGSIGDMVYFHSYRNPGLVIDIAADIRAMNDQAINSRHTGMLILGGGLVKHHICNANLMRNGADFSVFINVAQEFDGSDAGARPDEAVSWGKIRANANPVKLYAEVSLVFPLIVAQTFAKDFKPEDAAAAAAAAAAAKKK